MVLPLPGKLPDPHFLLVGLAWQMILEPSYPPVEWVGNFIRQTPVLLPPVSPGIFTVVLFMLGVKRTLTDDGLTLSDVLISNLTSVRTLILLILNLLIMEISCGSMIVKLTVVLHSYAKFQADVIPSLPKRYHQLLS